jgi:DNA-binding FadR family transcriptional regulator/AraC-like DNA-binding protein
LLFNTCSADLADRALTGLVSFITENTFKNDDLLPDQAELSYKLRLPKECIRWALSALAILGAIQITATGTYVQNYALLTLTGSRSIKEIVLGCLKMIRDTYDARRLIESRQIELCARYAAFCDTTELSHYLDEMKAVSDAQPFDTLRFAQLHYRFDMIVADLAGNIVLQSALKTIRKLEIATHLRLLNLMGTAQNSLERHQEILSAIRSHNVREAHDAAENHFISAEKTINSLTVWQIDSSSHAPPDGDLAFMVLQDSYPGLNSDRPECYSSNKLVDKALRFMRKNIRSASLKLIADKLEITPEYLSALIKRETGNRFRDLLVERKIEVAKDMLLYTSLSIKEIASQVGYTDADHFGRVFSKHTGNSPGAYRKTMGN